MSELFAIDGSLDLPDGSEEQRPTSDEEEEEEGDQVSGAVAVRDDRCAVVGCGPREAILVISRACCRIWTPLYFLQVQQLAPWT